MGGKIKTHRDLDVYRMAFEAAMKIFIETQKLLEGGISQGKLNDAEAEAAETQVWLEFAAKCHYLDPIVACELYTTYDHILGKLVNMILHPEHWTIGE